MAGIRGRIPKDIYTWTRPGSGYGRGSGHGLLSKVGGLPTIASSTVVARFDGLGGAQNWTWTAPAPHYICGEAWIGVQHSKVPAHLIIRLCQSNMRLPLLSKHKPVQYIGQYLISLRPLLSFSNGHIGQFQKPPHSKRGLL